MPKDEIDLRRPFHEIEDELGIAKEVDDVHPSHLGHHPSRSYYRAPDDPNTEELERMRRKFDKVARKYAKS